VGCKQQSAMLRTEPGSQVPPCLEGSEEVSKMHFGGSTKETESSLRIRDQYTCIDNKKQMMRQLKIQNRNERRDLEVVCLRVLNGELVKEMKTGDGVFVGSS